MKALNDGGRLITRAPLMMCSVNPVNLGLWVHFVSRLKTPSQESAGIWAS